MDNVTTTGVPAGSPRWYAHRRARDRRCPAGPAGALAFHAGLPGYAATPLAELPALARELNVARLFVKDESARLGLPAFRSLGAFWAVAQVLAARAGLPGPHAYGTRVGTDPSLPCVRLLHRGGRRQVRRGLPGVLANAVLRLASQR